MKMWIGSALYQWFSLMAWVIFFLHIVGPLIPIVCLNTTTYLDIMADLMTPFMTKVHPILLLPLLAGQCMSQIKKKKMDQDNEFCVKVAITVTNAIIKLSTLHDKLKL